MTRCEYTLPVGIDKFILILQTALISQLLKLVEFPSGRVWPPPYLPPHMWFCHVKFLQHASQQIIDNLLLPTIIFSPPAFNFLGNHVSSQEERHGHKKCFIESPVGDNPNFHFFWQLLTCTMYLFITYLLCLLLIYLIFALQRKSSCKTEEKRQRTRKWRNSIT